ncbi:MAG: hypothetical protein JNN01_08020 [Opitutaceae bacterium]|nr:hypothetical protein [Opitutaceae bacterium]
MEPLLQFIGRLHPLAVHLPIGVFVLLAVVETIGLVRPAARLTPPLRSLFLALGLLSAVSAAGFGWLLARHGDYDATLLERHRWLGTGFAGLALGLFLVRRHLRAYASGLIVSLALLGAAGHLGGSLTHGEQYLTLAKAIPSAPAHAAPEEAKVFDEVIHPILKERCVACHGPTKSNGDLRYDTRDYVLKGGKSGPTFKAGPPPTSLLLKRIHLPLEAKEHMPPKGKPQPTDDEMTLLEWWIDAGAPVDGRVADHAPSASVLDLMAARLGIPAAPAPDRPTMLGEAQRLEQQLGIVLRPLAQDGPWLAANARLRRSAFGDRELAALSSVAGALAWLDLGETSVTDAGLAGLARMKQLRRLQLDHTAVTGAGLVHLSGLPRLESLNLVGTSLTDADLRLLAKLPRLRTLYVWNTMVSDEALSELARQQTDQRKLTRWRSEISDLEARIRSETFKVNRGVSPLPVPAPATAPGPRETTAPAPAQAPATKPLP